MSSECEYSRLCHSRDAHLASKSTRYLLPLLTCKRYLYETLSEHMDIDIGNFTAHRCPIDNLAWTKVQYHDDRPPPRHGSTV
jgi:hypothetical protein